MASTTIVISEGSLKTLSGVTTGDSGGGAHAFGDGVLAIVNPNTEDADVELRWTDGGKLSDVHTVASQWSGASGTNHRPGVVYDVDISGDGSVDCELVGDAVDDPNDGYDDDVTHVAYLNKGVDDFPNSDLHNNFGQIQEPGEGEGGYFEDPCYTSAPNYCEPYWSSDDGPEYEGTLDDWAANFNAWKAGGLESVPICDPCDIGICNPCDSLPGLCTDPCELIDLCDLSARGAVASNVSQPPNVATVILTGVTTADSPMNGALSSVDVGANHYIFPAASSGRSLGTSLGTADVTGNYRAKQYVHKVVVTLTSDATPNGYAAGKNLVWTYTIDGGPVQTISQTAGRTDTVTLTEFGNQNRAGTHKSLKLYKNGVKVGVFSVLPRPRYHHHHHKHHHHNAA